MTHTQPLNHLSTSRWFEVVDEAMKVVECEERVFVGTAALALFKNVRGRIMMVLLLTRRILRSTFLNIL